jgi:hypothetical protein
MKIMMKIEKRAMKRDTNLIYIVVSFHWMANWLVWFMVFYATFNNFSVISWRSVLFVEETRGPGENPRPTARHIEDERTSNFFARFSVYWGNIQMVTLYTSLIYPPGDSWSVWEHIMTIKQNCRLLHKAMTIFYFYLLTDFVFLFQCYTRDRYCKLIVNLLRVKSHLKF